MSAPRKFAVRNLRLCTKDCVCLYVCPCGATDTEDSIIDVDKCTGCGACVEACPSGAIYLMPATFPPQQRKQNDVLEAMKALSQTKADEEQIARQSAANAGGEGLARLMQAAAMSMRLVHEDIMRESGYMLPQSANAQALLARIADSEGEAAQAARELLEMIPCNEPEGEAAAQ